MIDAAVIGGGAIGCAIARELTKRSLQVAVLERLGRCGMETSSRSSEVIHRGIYYPQISLKSRFCIKGRELLLTYMKEKNITFDLCGKLVVAKHDNVTRLKHLFDFGSDKLGFSDLKWLSSSEIRHLEPEVECSAAIWSPLSGIFDSQSVISHMIEDIELSNTNSMVVNNCQFLSARRVVSGQHFELETSLGPITAKHLILAPGLFAPDAMSLVHAFPTSVIPVAKYAKGYYFRLHSKEAKQPFQHLVYPLPEEGGLGIHSTINLAGEVRFGPNVEWLHRSDSRKFPDYSFPEDVSVLEKSFIDSISDYWPAILDDTKYSLQPDYAGIRPKVAVPNGYPDFIILNTKDHRIPGLICLAGMESPGWTSSLAVAAHVSNMIDS